MKFIFKVFVLTFILSGCSHPDSSVDDRPEPATPTDNSKYKNERFAPLNNPGIMLGSDLGSIIRKAYQIGDYSMMLRFTSKSTIEQYGEEHLIECYKNLDMGMEIQLKSITKEGEIQIMNYEAIKQATKVMVRLPVVIENDTAKIQPDMPCSGSLYKGELPMNRQGEGETRGN